MWCGCISDEAWGGELCCFHVCGRVGDDVYDDGRRGGWRVKMRKHSSLSLSLSLSWGFYVPTYFMEC
jgi:hypothetical protein